MKKPLLLFFMLIILSKLSAQSIPYLLSNEAVYHQMDRFEVLYGNDSRIHTAQKPYTRDNVVRYALALDSMKGKLSKLDRAALQYIYDDNNELLMPSELPTTLGGKQQPVAAENGTPQYSVNKKAMLKHFYKTPANFFEAHGRYFDIKINPVAQFSYGRELNDPDPAFFNQRGGEIRGNIDNRIYFQSNIVETQARFQDLTPIRP